MKTNSSQTLIILWDSRTNLNKGKALSSEVREKLSLAVHNRTVEQKQNHQRACSHFEISLM
jgi:hypothetical protein